MKKIRLITAFLASIGMAGVAMGESQVDQLWSDLNADKNDALSADEAKGSDKVQAQWSLLDVDQDGQLSYKEFSMIDLTK